MKPTVILLSLVGIADVIGVGNLAGGDSAQSTSFRLVRRGQPVVQSDTTLPTQAARQAQADVARAQSDLSPKELPPTRATAPKPDDGAAVK
jgi:hypothetical protein